MKKIFSGKMDAHEKTSMEKIASLRRKMRESHKAASSCDGQLDGAPEESSKISVNIFSSDYPQAGAFKSLQKCPKPASSPHPPERKKSLNEEQERQIRAMLDQDDRISDMDKLEILSAVAKRSKEIGKDGMQMGDIVRREAERIINSQW